ncbi:hypothetical protein BVC80_33g22 [Macleaya cordata]|uniref:Uncharacterized protein n=1 Tax=Macleaya cordata TaxID=56857 RepID=A0A200QAM3_MACCD|nr:hypothetical protein BVC80_33g22 [Macleaya cordata]
MPSSSKKKKASKRKKKKASNTHSPPTNSQPEGDDLNTHDEKERISGVITSITSQDENQDQLMEEEKMDSSSSVGLSTSNNKPMLEESENGGENNPSQKIEEVVEVMEEIVSELKTEGDSGNGSVCIEYVESAKESGNGDSSSSSSDSSSDEESQLVDKNRSSVIEESGEFNEGVEDCNSVAGIVPPLDSIEKIVSSVEELETQVVVVTKAETIEDSSSIGLPSNEIDDKTLPSSDPLSVSTSNGGDHQKESKISESLQKQEQEELAIVPPTVQPTSWKSCCGLFDLLTGSNR